MPGVQRMVKSGVPLPGCRACSSAIEFLLCTALDGPVLSCCWPRLCSVWYPHSASRRRVATQQSRLPSRARSPATARPVVACSWSLSTVGVARSPSSTIRLSGLPRRAHWHLSEFAASNRWREISSSRRYLHQRAGRPDHRIVDSRTRDLRISMEISHVETDHGDPRDRCGQLRGGLSSTRGSLLPARTGVLRRTVLRLATAATPREAAAHLTGRWPFSRPMSDRGRCGAPGR